ncbi:uncharacterized protein N7458_003746 [Penicillium daleae]|uniref:Uncharacterized protein n=1 Tax=Penicillium daleae TaxID=63821 RepID=A0AAD6CAF0_9EURO|nr:uncharacterized protein N7458_003746 [Penicillium daleae]KAJ5456163.1 hypothetical protein N7458_003746 [Penicillium daleae]
MSQRPSPSCRQAGSSRAQGGAPLGKSPVITIEAPGAEKPLRATNTVPERHQPGREGQVGGERDGIRYRYFMHYVEGTLMPFLVMTLVNDTAGLKDKKQKDKYPLLAAYAKRLERLTVTRRPL